MLVACIMLLISCLLGTSVYFVDYALCPGARWNYLRWFLYMLIFIVVTLPFILLPTDGSEIGSLKQLAPVHLLIVK